MTSGKAQFKPDAANLKDLGPEVRKKRKFRKKLRRLCCLAALLAVVITILLLLLHRPGRYNPPEVVDEKRVPTYLTHHLGETINNGLQQDDPFDLPVDQHKMNEVIAWQHKHKWSKQFGDLAYSAPEVFFATDTITLMGAVTVAGREIVVTVVGKPKLDQKGLLNLNLTKVKIGAVNITPIARIIAKAAYRKRLETRPMDKDDIRAKIWPSLLNNKPFDPVFRVKDVYQEKRNVRLKKLTIEPQKLTLRLSPLPHNNE
ncbi:hypothetical protein ES703_44067 [subsurface metagenome]